MAGQAFSAFQSGPESLVTPVGLQARSLLLILAIAIMPQSTLIGALLYLSWWLIPFKAVKAAADVDLPDPQALRLRLFNWRWLWGGFCILSLLTGLSSAMPLWHLAGWLSHYLLPFLLIWGTVRALQSGRCQALELVLGILLGSLGLALAGLANYFLHWAPHLQGLCFEAYNGFCLLDFYMLAEDRARGFSMHPNLLGALLALPVPLWLWSQRFQRWRVLSAASALLVCLCLLVTYSRAAWLAAAVALVLGAVWFFKLHSRAWLALGLGGGLVGLVLAGSGLLTVIWARLASLFQAGGSQNSRLMLWQAGGRMLQEHGLWGTGLLQLEPLLPLYLSEPVPGGAGHLHNWYLQVAVESGLPAALLFFALLLALLASPKDLGELGKACWLAWAGLLLACCFDIALLDFRLAFELCLLLAMILADRQSKREAGASL